MPKRKNDLIALFEQWKFRAPLAIDEIDMQNVVDDDGDDLSGTCDVVEFVDNEANVI